MRILQIMPSFHMGGGQKFPIELANELVKKDSNEVFLCSIHKIDNDFILLQQLDPKVHLVSLDKSIGFSVITFFKLFNLIRKLKPDIVHTHLRALTYASLALILFRTPTVHTLHNLAHKETIPTLQKVYKFLFDYFNVVPVSISDKVLESTKLLYGHKYKEMIYNGVDALLKTNEYENVKKEIDSFKKTNETKILLNVGRVSKQKNQLMFVRAIKKLNMIDVVLVVIGPLDIDEGYDSAFIEAIKNTDNIHYLGLKNNVGDYLCCSDALCLSSIYEGLPLVVLESMSMGVPIVSTPAGGVPDVVKNAINGYIATDFEEKSFEKVLTKFYLEPIKDYESIKRIYAENYSMKICAKKYYSLYERLI